MFVSRESISIVPRILSSVQSEFQSESCAVDTASEYTDPKFSGAAPLGLQIHGGVEIKCEYRNGRSQSSDSREKIGRMMGADGIVSSYV